MREGAQHAAARWTGVGLMAAVVSLGAVWWIWGTSPWREAAGGWSVALLNAVGAFLINRVSVRPAGQKFPLKGIVFNILRIFVLLGVLVAVFGWLGKKGFYPFLVAMFAAYFVFLSGEIARLHRSVVKGS